MIRAFCLYSIGQYIIQKNVYCVYTSTLWQFPGVCWFLVENASVSVTMSLVSMDNCVSKECTFVLFVTMSWIYVC